MSTFRLEDYPKLLWEPTDDQRVAIELLPSNKGFIDADATGLGKTYSALCSFAVLSKYREDAHLLVLSTKSSVAPWRQHLVEGTNFSFREFTVDNPEIDSLSVIAHEVTIMTYTGVRKFPNYLAKLFQQKSVIIAADEFHKAGDPTTLIGGTVRYLRKYARYFWGLTATPLGNHLESLYNVVDIVRPGYLGHNWPAFMRKYCHTRKVRRGPRFVTEVIGLKNPKLLAEKLRKVMLRRDLVMKVNFHREVVRLPQKEMDLYLVAAAGDLGGDLKQFSARLPDLQLVVNNAATASKTDGERLYNEDYLTIGSKEKHLLGIIRDIQERNQPTVVFTSSLWTQKRLLAVIERNLSPTRLLQINGNSTTDERFDISESFGKRDILVMSPAGGESLNLQASGSLIFFDLPFDLRQFVQAAGRVVRMDTTYEEVDIYILEALETIDSYKSLMVFSNSQQFEAVMMGTTTLPSAKGKIPKGVLEKLRRSLLWKVKELVQRNK